MNVEYVSLRTRVLRMLYQVLTSDDCLIHESTDFLGTMAVLELTQDLHEMFPDEISQPHYRAIHRTQPQSPPTVE